MNNPIIQEVRDAREALAAKFNFDLHRIIADAIARQVQQRTVNRQSNPNKSLRPFLAAVPHREPDETDRLPE